MYEIQVGIGLTNCIHNIELWCNGSTTDFGSVCLGSNPDSSTINNFQGYSLRETLGNAE